MRYTVLGRTQIKATSTAFGCLPIQRISFDEAAKILNKARESGINYFDTARAYSDSEAKINYAFKGDYKGIYIATKTAAKNAEGFWKDLETSLNTLGTDCIDVYQFHNPGFMPVPGGEDGLYDAAVEAKKQGKIRFISITNHTLDRAFECVNSGLYDTLQYPLNHLATDKELELLKLCEEKKVGFIAMKGMSGGLITDARIPFSFFREHSYAVPIWGIQKMSELNEFLAMEDNPPSLDEMKPLIEKDRNELIGSFCRSCGYCLPCPANIPIPNANRMIQLLTRSPEKNWLTPDFKAQMEKINDCIKCGACEKRCPYSLKPYETMKEHLKFYLERYEAVNGK